ncbi:MAG: hypothetical protein U1C56_02755, partial [Candidatus Curtissbacteria bacterium]|nr:hypothetical protein [Candidatus Curtissbacteria bacterium]
GINKVGIVVGLATKENEKELAEKVTYMSKPALQEYSKEVRGHITANWQIELDEEMMFLFLKLKKKLGKNLSNKECLRKMLEQMTGAEKIPGDFSTTSNKQPIASQKPTRYIPVHKKRHLSPHCAYQNCHRPADTIHHPNRFAIIPSHESLQPLCKQHHEFAHNGISEPMHQTDYQYREYRQASLLL